MTECCCDDIIIEVNEEGVDGVGIASIELVSTVGITKNYRINLTNGTYFDYSISDGSSIASISKTSSAGLVDTYTVFLTNGDTSTFEVTNGNGISSITKTSTDNLTDTYTISYTNGTTSTFSVTNGNSIASVSKVSTQVLTDTYEITYTDEDKSSDSFTVVNGRGITSIAKTSTSGLVDTYTVTYNDSSTSTFTVTNGEKGDKGDTGDTGNGIQSITLLSESGLVKTYRITMTDGTHFDFDVTDGEKGDTGETGATGNGIASIEKTETVGLVDTYTITMTDGTTTTFDVTNGSDMWGNITGTLSDQTDLQNALDSKAPAITETASGSIASFTDGSALPVTALSVGIEPVQDLHGYDNPWPAGGGKNKLPIENYEIFSNGITYSITSDGKIVANGTASEGVSSFYFYGQTGRKYPAGSYVLTGCPSGGGTNTYSIRQITNGTYVGQDTGSGRTLEIEQDDIVVFYARVAQGVTVSNLVFEPMLRLATETDATFTPYSNICQITGWDSAVVTRTGKNLFSSAINSGYTISTAGSYIVDQNRSATEEFIKISPNTAYTLSYVNSSNEYCGVHFYDANKNYLDLLVWGANPRTFTSLENAYYVRFSFRTNTAITNAQLELGSVPSSYEPYQGTSVTIDLDGTRYGGTLDVTTGMLTVDRGYREFYGTETYWKAHGDIPSGFYIDVSGDYYKNNYQRNFAICNQYKQKMYSQITNVQNGEFGIGGNGFNRLIFKNTNATTVEEWKALVVQNPIHVVYKLASPVTIPLTPSQMQTLLGENHIWADTGDVEVTYRADTKLFIQEQIAESQRATRSLIAGIETEMVASKNYSTGDLLIVGDTLYTVTANIASGGSITVGTNVAVTTVAEQLLALANA